MFYQQQIGQQIGRNENENGILSSQLIPAPDLEICQKVSREMEMYCRKLGYDKFRSGISNRLRKSKNWDEFVYSIQMGSEDTPFEKRKHKRYELTASCPHLGDYIIDLEDKRTIVRDDGFDLYVSFRSETSICTMRNILMTYKEEFLQYLTAVRPYTVKFRKNVENINCFFIHEITVLRSHEILAKFLVRPELKKILSTS